MKNVALYFLVVGLLACNSTDSNPQAATGDGDELTGEFTLYNTNDFVRDLVGAQCDWMQACVATVGNPFGDRASCESLYGFAAKSAMSQIGSVDNASLFRIDAGQAQLCIAAIAQAACAAPPDWQTLQQCQGVLIGRLNDGECCDARGGCAPNLTCEMGNQQVGYCSLVGDLGETCRNQACQADLTCLRADDVFECQRSLALGPGEPCLQTFDCGANLICDYQLGVEIKSCLPAPGLGDYCHTFERPCAQGLHCYGEGGQTCHTEAPVDGVGCSDNSNCGVDALCISNICTQRAAQDGPCDDDEMCQQGLECVDSVCGTYPVPVAEGDACHPDGPACPGALGSEGCMPSADGYRCKQGGEAGDDCNDNAPCALFKGFNCDPSSAKCVALPSQGQPCQQLCFPFFSLYCDVVAAVPTCQVRKPAGTACTLLSDDEDLLFTQCEVFSVCVDLGSGNTCTSYDDLNAQYNEVCQ